MVNNLSNMRIEESFARLLIAISRGVKKVYQCPETGNYDFPYKIYIDNNGFPALQKDFVPKKNFKEFSIEDALRLEIFGTVPLSEEQERIFSELYLPSFNINRFD